MRGRIGMGVLPLATSACLGASGARADCSVDQIVFKLGHSEKTTMHITSGDLCGIGFNLGGISIDRIEFTRPSHGQAGWNGNVAYPVVGYRFARGYRGPDDFSYDIVGYQMPSRSEPGGPGRVHISVHVDTQ